MGHGAGKRGMFAVAALTVVACTTARAEPADPRAAATSTSSVDVRVGWTLLKEGAAEGRIEQDAKHPASDKPHLLRIQVTKHPGPGGGRVGASNDVDLNVEQGRWYDITFAGVTERGSIGLVFSLESADGRVLARTTLPEVGRMPRRSPGPGGSPTRPATAATTGPPVPRWTEYLVSLHARGSDPHARLVIHPIEPTNVWLEGLTLTPRRAGADAPSPGGDVSQQKKEQR